MFAGYVPLASQSPYPIIIYFLANYRPHVSQFVECNAVNVSLLLNVKKQQLSDFLTENLPILNPYLPQKSKNWRPHSSKSIENATQSSGLVAHV